MASYYARRRIPVLTAVPLSKWMYRIVVASKRSSPSYEWHTAGTVQYGLVL